ncbi:MAG: cadherin domain-containing protein, partial [Pseudomonadota bacterium]
MSDQNENQGQPKRGPETIDSALDREVGQQGGERRREDAQEVKIDSDSSDQAGQAPRAGGYGSPEFAADGDREGTGNRQATSAVVDEQQVGARTVSLDDTQVFSSGAEARRDTAATLTESPQSDGESPAAVGQSPVAQGSQSRPTTPPAHAMQHDTEPPEPVVADNNPDAPSGRFIPVEPAPAHNDGTEAQRPASSEDEDAQEAANEQASNANDEPQAASDVDGAAIAISDGAGAADEISEDANHGDRVGIVATAPSGSDGVVTYSLADDADGRFAIDSATGEVYVAAPELLDFEGIQSHEIVVNATSPNGTVSTQNFVIRVNDHDEFALSPVADGDASGDRVAENARVGDTVGIAASAVDEDGSDNAVQYSLSENPNATFAIDPNSGVVTVADPTGIDFESTRSIQIEVTATSEDGSTSTQRFDISVEDINEYTITPTGDTDSSLNLVSENARIGDLVGVAAAAEDADATDAVTYSLSSNPNGAFAIDSDTGVVSVANPAGIDFESAQSMQIEVTATSSDGSTSTQAFEIAVTDENEFDISVAVDGDGAADTVAEDAAAGDQVGVTAFAGDADGSGSGVEYSLSENPNDAFAIDPVRGVVTVDDPEALDFESSPSMQIEVTAASQDGSTSTQTFDIAVTDADEFDVAPVSDLDNSANAVSENAAIGDTVGVAALAQDADGSSNAVEFTLSENPGDAFAIDPESGIVTVADASALDFESAPLMQIEVTATSQDGSTSTQTFDITITDQNEFDISTVSDLSIGANTVTESAEAGASVGVTAFASDGDGSSNVVEYSLSENPGGAFAIDAHSGEVTVANPEALDFESAESMRIDVTATSQDGSSSTQTFEIAVTDSNEFDVTPVSDTNGDRNSVAENASAGDTVGVTAFANDADGSANGVAYSLSENPHEAFAIDPTTGEVTVANPASLDFESAQSMQIEVTATSQDGSSSTQTFDIAVTDSNEFDVSAASDINGAANSVAENASVGDPVGITAFATDADGSANGVAYSLSENPDGAFAIDPTTGEVTVADPAGLDFESA